MVSAHPTLRFEDVIRRKPRGAGVLSVEEHLHCTYNARGAFYQFLRALPPSKGNTVLLPAFHCTTVVQPVLHAGYRPAFYRINRDLSIHGQDLAEKLSRDVAAVVVINYLGFPAEMDCVSKLPNRADFYVVEDCAHSFLSWRDGEAHLTGGRGDLSLYSFYKTVPCFAGGALRIHAQDFSFQTSNTSPGPRQSLVIFKRLLEQVVDNSNDGFLRSSLLSLERWRVARKKRNTPDPDGRLGLGNDPHLFEEHLASSKMPWFCRAILRKCDFNEIALRRRRNYLLYGEHLKEHPALHKLFPVLPEDVCPWAFPVLLTHRGAHDHLLREQGVPLFTFGDVLHPLLQQSDRNTREHAEHLSQHLLLLSIHQNLETQEIRGFAQKINAFFESLESSPQQVLMQNGPGPGRRRTA